MTALAAPPDAGWSRLHPLTPVLRAGRGFAVVIAITTQQGLTRLSFTGFLVAVAIAVPVFGVFGLLSWRATRYRVDGGELLVDSGVLQRRSRRVPLSRLQSVDVVRPLVARVLGLAELRLEVAGGGETEAPLAYLNDADAQALRRRLLAVAGGTAEQGPEVVEPEERLLVQVPTGALVTSVLLGAPTIVGAVVLVVLLVSVALDPRAAGAVVSAAVPVLIGTAGLSVRRVLVEYGFTVAESPDGLRLRHGLLETRAQTIPLDRVQSVRLLEPLLWRRRGWVRVEVDVAGYAAGGEQQSTTSALLPVAPADFARALVTRVLGSALPPVVAPAPRRARWLAPFSARRLALGLDDRHLVATSGVLTTTTDVVPLRKVQSLRLSAGPWQRRLRLATLHADTAGRRLPGAVGEHRDAAEAEALLAELADRVRLERRR